MEFDARGGLAALASDGRLAALASEYGEGMRRAFDVDVREKRTLMNGNVLRSMRVYLSEYGDDAARIVRAFYYPPYNGRAKGRPMGPEFFTKGFRWLSNEILLGIGD